MLSLFGLGDNPLAPVRSGVAGHGATFSPVETVSALWALADPREIPSIGERRHDRAVADGGIHDRPQRPLVSTLTGPLHLGMSGPTMLT